MANFNITSPTITGIPITQLPVVPHAVVSSALTQTPALITVEARRNRSQLIRRIKSQ